MAPMAAMLLVGSGVALAELVTCDLTDPCYGTPEGDRIDSNENLGVPSNGETIYALGGNDGVYPLGGNDTVYASSGDDTVEGSGGSDTVYGGGGKDTIYADLGDTTDSEDRSYGGGGNDQIFADDGNVDKINCGKGSDLVQYDQGIDTIKSCEIKQAF